MNIFVAVSPEKAAPQGSEFAVEIYQSSDEDCWIAESDALPIATEAPTIDALIERVWAIAPEVAELNGHVGELNLRFVVHTRNRR